MCVRVCVWRAYLRFFLFYLFIYLLIFLYYYIVRFVWGSFFHKEATNPIEIKFDVPIFQYIPVVKEFLQMAQATSSYNHTPDQVRSSCIVYLFLYFHLSDALFPLFPHARALLLCIHVFSCQNSFLLLLFSAYTPIRSWLCYIGTILMSRPH